MTNFLKRLFSWMNLAQFAMVVLMFCTTSFKSFSFEWVVFTVALSAYGILNYIEGFGDARK